MASILTNYSAMTALQTLRNVTNNLGETQARISTGLKVRSGKDNAAYFNISSTMRGDSGMYKSINEGLSLTKNSLATARAGAEQFVKIATEFVERVAFAQGESLDHNDVIKELNELVGRMETVVSQSTFNGDNLVDTPAFRMNSAGQYIYNDGTNDVVTKDPNLFEAVEPIERTVVTGISRASGGFGVTTITFNEVSLGDIANQFKNMVNGAGVDTAATGINQYADIVNSDGEIQGGAGLGDLAHLAAAQQAFIDDTNSHAIEGLDLSALKHDLLAKVLVKAEAQLKRAVDAATSLGIAEKSIEVQQDFLKTLTDQIDGGIGGMIDADMEQEASRLQALQVQQQLATQSLSIANQNPHNILALFR